MQEKIQVENIFLWLEITPFMIICTLQAYPSSHRRPLKSLREHTTAVFSLVAMELMGCSNKMSSRTVKPRSINLISPWWFLLQVSPTHVIFFRYCVAKLFVEIDILW